MKNLTATTKILLTQKQARNQIKNSGRHINVISLTVWQKLKDLEIFSNIKLEAQDKTLLS